MLPQLSSLFLADATQLQEVFRHSSGDNVMNEMEIVLPNLTEITLSNLTNFVDICHGCKLHADKLLQLHIYDCPKTASSLRKIKRKLQKEAGLGDGEDSHYLELKNDENEAAAEDDEDSPIYEYPTSSKTDYVKDPSVPNLAWDKGKTKFVVDKDEEAAAEDDEDSYFGTELLTKLNI